MNSVTQGVLKHKMGLLNLAAELGNVSQGCKVMGFSRDTFYRYKSAVEANGICERFHKTIQQEFYQAAFRSTAVSPTAKTCLDSLCRKYAG